MSSSLLSPALAFPTTLSSSSFVIFSIYLAPFSQILSRSFLTFLLHLAPFFHNPLPLPPYSLSLMISLLQRSVTSPQQGLFFYAGLNYPEKGNQCILTGNKTAMGKGSLTWLSASFTLSYFSLTSLPYQQGLCLSYELLSNLKTDTSI